MRPSHIAFAATIVALGVMGLGAGGTPPWDGIPEGVPGRAAIIDVCAAIEAAAGLGLMFPRTVRLACRVLLPLLLLSLLLLRVPALLREPFMMVRWEAFAEIAVLCAGVWTLFAAHAGAWERRRVKFAVGARGVAAARWLVIVSLPVFGLSHFAYSGFTAALVPKWLGSGLAWTYLTGVADIAAGIALLVRFRPHLVASLEAAMLGIITLLVWVPRVVETPGGAGNWNELLISAAIAAGVWRVADTYRDA